MSKPEKKLQDKCIAYLKANRIYHINQFGNGWSAKGAPDIVACINGKFVAFELKVGSNDMQDDQRIHKIRIERNGGSHYSPYTFDEFKSIVEVLTNNRKGE